MREINREAAEDIILDEVSRFYDTYHRREKFIPGVTRIPVSGRVYDAEEMRNLVKASLDFWLTAGPWAERFEEAFAQRIGVNHCAFVNSGSSANLLAFMALTQPELEDAQIKRGDEVITVAAGFPTTVSPIIQYGAVPVFVDIEPVVGGTYNVDVGELEKAVSGKTKAVILAHTLGNPFNIDAVKSFCIQHRLWLIEDCCDALGSVYRGQNVGTFGDVSTFSFYPAHQITTGEGGMVCTKHGYLNRIIESLRDWGRDCSCRPGQDNRCGKRFGHKFDGLPEEWDHKYTYSRFGYNLKATDLQAAIGLAQLGKLDAFTYARRSNWVSLRTELEKTLQNHFHLPLPIFNSNPSWFGFALTVGLGLKRAEVVRRLEEAKIQTRMLFSGDLTRQPCFMDLKHGIDYRVVGPLSNTERALYRTFWIGVYPGITPDMLDYMVEKLNEAVR